MGIDKENLKKIIKEEVTKVIKSNMLQENKIFEYLREIADWMEENAIRDPEDGVKAWLKMYPEVSPEVAQALMDNADEIYEYI